MARRYKYGMRMQDASKILLCIAYYYYYRTTSKLLLVLPYYYMYKLRTKAPPDKSYEILQIPMEAWSTEAKANQGLTYCSGK